MKKQITVLMLGVAACSILSGALLGVLRSEAPTNSSQRTLTFAERVAYQKAIEEVYWRHRIWPKEQPDPKPSLDAVMTEVQLKKKVADYLRNSQAVEDYWQTLITVEQLQAEMDRMANHTKQPEVLCEIFAALGNDPLIVAECLARPILSERLKAATVGRPKGTLASWEARAPAQVTVRMAAAIANYTLPVITSPSAGCIDDTWTPTSLTNAPDARGAHTAVWTGSEMIIWGGDGGGSTGSRYNPSTDSWTATSTTNAPSGRLNHTAVWTGSEMIIWGGSSGSSLNTGGRYDPSIDSWTPTSTTNAPTARELHTAVWTGSEMIVWGGLGAGLFNTGGRYNPSTDSWTATSTINAPDARAAHTAVWTGSEMIIWGGFLFNTGGRYHPSTDTWTATTTVNAPSARYRHTAVWTGTQMIIWGGYNNVSFFNTGGRYNPNIDSWTATSTTNAPTARADHTAVWAGGEMIVWGGGGPASGAAYLNTGARYPEESDAPAPTPTATATATPGIGTGGKYNLSADSWIATSITNAPDARAAHTAVWTGSEMIIWGGEDGNLHNDGGRYCAQAPTPTSTPTATPTATATATATAIATVTPTASATTTPCAGRCTPTPRPRPTPAPRATP